MRPIAKGAGKAIFVKAGFNATVRAAKTMVRASFLVFMLIGSYWCV